MKTAGLTVAVLALVILVATSVHAEEQTITLTNPGEIADAMALLEAISKQADRVSECVEKKLAPEQKCFCLYPAELDRVKQKYEVAIRKYPEWKDKIVFWVLDGVSHNLLIPSIREQLEVKCDKP